MSFLKKLGHVALTAGKYLLGSYLGGVSKDVPIPTPDTLLHIVQQVIHAELGGVRLNLTGDQKRVLASVAVEQIILKSALAHGKKLSDPVKFRADVEGLVGKVADILNDFHEDAVQTGDLS